MVGGAEIDGLSKLELLFLLILLLQTILVTHTDSPYEEAGSSILFCCALPSYFSCMLIGLYWLTCRIVDLI